MGNTSGWYDPVCYQFFFYAHSNANTEKSILNACHEFVGELTPYYALWLSMNGRILSKQWTEGGCKVVSISDAEALEKYGDSVSSCTAKSLELSLIPGKELANFAVSSRCIDKKRKEQIMRYTDLRELATLDKRTQKDWLYNMMNCPTDDLRGIYFPKRCYMPNDIPLKLYYASFCSSDTVAYLNEIVKDIDISTFHSGNMRPQYLHRVFVSIPRYILDATNQTFRLQYVWKERLTRLCNIFENSTGYMKMDSCEIRHSSPLLSGSGSFIPGFSQHLPDIAWAMCLTDRQIKALGGMEYLKTSQAFYHIEPLKNNKFYLQLTPDISIVTRNEATKLWNIVSPHLQSTPSFFHSIAEVPVSFRMGIDYNKLQIDDYGRYQILI